VSRTWNADVDLSLDTATNLIERQFPALAPARLGLLGAGWDNTAFLVNDQVVFRFPRRRVAVRLIERKVEVLPLLEAHLPLPITVPTMVGEPADGYPHPFAGYPLIAGTTACRVAWSEEERARNAAPLGRFLAALHRTPVSEATRAEEPAREIEPSEVSARERLRALAPALGGLDIEALAERVERLAAVPAWEGPTGWVHGDLYARHLLVDEERRLCGVIDWGDVHLGAPDLDLMIAFSFLPPAARGAFREAYGGINAAAWDRARCRALHYGMSLMEYGIDIGDAAIRAAGEYALRSAGHG
jgi:aminoglycoside phosphotransferase (APT) family kinase protein